MAPLPAVSSKAVVLQPVCIVDHVCSVEPDALQALVGKDVGGSRRLGRAWPCVAKGATGSSVTARAPCQSTPGVAHMPRIAAPAKPRHSRGRLRRTLTWRSGSEPEPFSRLRQVHTAGAAGYPCIRRRFQFQSWRQR